MATPSRRQSVPAALRRRRPPPHRSRRWPPAPATGVDHAASSTHRSNDMNYRTISTASADTAAAMASGRQHEADEEVEEEAEYDPDGDVRRYLDFVIPEPLYFGGTPLAPSPDIAVGDLGPFGAMEPNEYLIPGLTSNGDGLDLLALLPPPEIEYPGIPPTPEIADMHDSMEEDDEAMIDSMIQEQLCNSSVEILDSSWIPDAATLSSSQEYFDPMCFPPDPMSSTIVDSSAGVSASTSSSVAPFCSSDYAVQPAIVAVSPEMLDCFARALVRETRYRNDFVSIKVTTHGSRFFHSIFEVQYFIQGSLRTDYYNMAIDDRNYAWLIGFVEVDGGVVAAIGVGGVLETFCRTVCASIAREVAKLDDVDNVATAPHEPPQAPMMIIENITEQELFTPLLLPPPPPPQERLQGEEEVLVVGEQAYMNSALFVGSSSHEPDLDAVVNISTSDSSSSDSSMAPEQARGGESSSSRPRSNNMRMSTRPKPSLAEQRERTKNVKLSDVAVYFHLPIHKAAEKLGICSTALKCICRRFGIGRWPHRKVRSLNKLIDTLQQTLGRRKTGFQTEGIKRELDRLRREREQLYAGQKTSAAGDDDVATASTST